MNRKILIPCVCVSAALLSAWLLWGNQALSPSFYSIESDTLPEGFDGFRIAHVSDVHNSPLSAEGGKLLRLLEDVSPDMIAITGDLIDARQTDMELALDFIAAAVDIAPCYYVPGNHEARIEGYEDFAGRLEALGVMVMHDESTFIERGGDVIRLIGLYDPGFHASESTRQGNAILSEILYAMTEDEDSPFTLLLCHRPEIMDIYADCGVELALCGHTHGGQMRLPFAGGLVAPHQGWFPKIDAGLYSQDCLRMIVSRGVGNSLFPLRINNPPEVPVIELKKV